VIFDWFTRQQVEIIGRYQPQTVRYRPGPDAPFRLVRVRFVRVRYGAPLDPADFGGFRRGTERDVEQNDLEADGGAAELGRAIAAAPLLD
jgi:hypothetical protein